MTYSEALKFLNSFLNYEQITAYHYPGSFSLNRMERLLEGLGNPHRKYRVLHVAGTKGKGSTCVFAASILKAAGLKADTLWQVSQAAAVPPWVSTWQLLQAEAC
jgi:dihydrofolate synthase/folylpolyglutamate synthase